MMPRAIVLVLVASLGALGAWLPAHGAAQQKPVTAPGDVQERRRLLDLQRAAASQLQQARREERQPIESRRRSSMPAAA